MTPMRMTSREARRLAITSQRLVSAPPATRRGVMEIVRDIGYLQLDPTNVVARNPLLVLWSRLGTYDPAILETLLAKRELFETPSFILPTADLPIHAATMRAYRRATDARAAKDLRGRGDNAGGGTRAQHVQRWLTRNRHVRAEVLRRLRREGPLPLTAFEDRSIVSWTSGGWNDERNLTMMLAVLQRRGEIIVAGRRRGQKLWGLAEDWLSSARPIAGLALEREATQRALRATGLATLKQLKWHYAFSRHISQRALDSLENDGVIARVEIADAKWNGAYYTLRRPRKREWEERTTLLSPFDSLIIDRPRTLELFEYFYRMEIYVPPHLRKLGFWAMPVLHGDRIVGSVDPRFERADGVLVVNKVVLQPEAPQSAMRAIERAVDGLAAFVGAKSVRWARRAPVRAAPRRFAVGLPASRRPKAAATRNRRAAASVP
jgi:uncharacterized protein YcaQ